MPSNSRSNEASESKNIAAETTQTAPMSVPTPGHQFLKKQKTLLPRGVTYCNWVQTVQNKRGKTPSDRTGDYRKTTQAHTPPYSWYHCLIYKSFHQTWNKSGFGLSNNHSDATQWNQPFFQLNLKDLWNQKSHLRPHRHRCLLKHPFAISKRKKYFNFIFGWEEV